MNEYNILPYDKFGHLFKNDAYIPYIKLAISNDLYILMESSNCDDYIGFGIIGKSDNIKNKIKNLNLDSKIENIFNNRIKKEHNNNDWIYWADIDTEIDYPEEIAEAMINLYNLFKEKL